MISPRHAWICTTLSVFHGVLWWPQYDSPPPPLLTREVRIMHTFLVQTHSNDFQQVDWCQIEYLAFYKHTDWDVKIFNLILIYIGVVHRLVRWVLERSEYFSFIRDLYWHLDESQSKIKLFRTWYSSVAIVNADPQFCTARPVALQPCSTPIGAILSLVTNAYPEATARGREEHLQAWDTAGGKEGERYNSRAWISLRLGQQILLCAGAVRISDTPKEGNSSMNWSSSSHSST